ncbi:ATP-binding protein [Streptomyces sp. NPDC021100]|uniref:ATP-binding protein n=1 Tax=Streptomyces sp. NPDC021100 TaxID=3365114 RepID=UPI003792313F
MRHARVRVDEVAVAPDKCFRELTLDVDVPGAVRTARAVTVTTLAGWGLGALADDAALVVSELVGNVVHHAVPDGGRLRAGASRRARVAFLGWPKWLFIGVTDEDSSPPVVPVEEAFPPGRLDGSPDAVVSDRGRGLLIARRLSDALWWTPREGEGKTVFCRFDLRPEHD